MPCCDKHLKVIDAVGNIHIFPGAKRYELNPSRTFLVVTDAEDFPHTFQHFQSFLAENFEIAECVNGHWVWITNNCDPKPALPSKPCTNEGATIGVPC